MMTQQLLDALNDAVDSGVVNEQELFDTIARGHQRRKHATLERISKSIDEGVSEAEFIAVINKQR